MAAGASICGRIGAWKLMVLWFGRTVRDQLPPLPLSERGQREARAETHRRANRASGLYGQQRTVDRGGRQVVC
jgi:hypothetical protein